MTLTDELGHEQLAVAHVNASRRLRDIELEIQAESFAQASSRGHDLISQMLSRWAFLHDVAITTSAVQIVEAATQTCLWRLLVVGAVKGFSDTAGVSNAEHQALLSAYREGISSTEPLWQVLSLFRVAEGVFQMRNARRAAAIAAGQVPAEPSERVPAAVNSPGRPTISGSLIPCDRMQAVSSPQSWTTFDRFSVMPLPTLILTAARSARTGGRTWPRLSKPCPGSGGSHASS